MYTREYSHTHVDARCICYARICAYARPIRNMDNMHVCRASAHMWCITYASCIDMCMAIFMCLHVCRAYAHMSCTTYARHTHHICTPCKCRSTMRVSQKCG